MVSRVIFSSRIILTRLCIHCAHSVLQNRGLSSINHCSLAELKTDSTLYVSTSLRIKCTVKMTYLCLCSYYLCNYHFTSIVSATFRAWALRHILSLQVCSDSFSIQAEFVNTRNVNSIQSHWEMNYFLGTNDINLVGKFLCHYIIIRGILFKSKPYKEVHLVISSRCLYSLSYLHQNKIGIWLLLAIVNFSLFFHIV